MNNLPIKKNTYKAVSDDGRRGARTHVRAPKRNSIVIVSLSIHI